MHFLDTGEADKMISRVEERMKRLVDSPPSLELPKPSDLLKEVSWLKGLNKREWNRVVSAFQNKAFAVGEVIVREDSQDDGLFIIVHGQVGVSIEKQKVDLLGPGSVIGEMMVLSGQARTATVTAETPVTTLWIQTAKMRHIMKESDSLVEELWRCSCNRFAENILSKQEPYNEWHKRELRQWLEYGEVIRPGNDGRVNLDGKIGILLSGEAMADDGNRLDFPSFLQSGRRYSFNSDARIYVREMKVPV